MGGEQMFAFLKAMQERMETQICFLPSKIDANQAMLAKMNAEMKASREERMAETRAWQS
jgi:hypothetical protein